MVAMAKRTLPSVTGWVCTYQGCNHRMSRDNNDAQSNATYIHGGDATCICCIEKGAPPLPGRAPLPCDRKANRCTRCLMIDGVHLPACPNRTEG